MNATMRVYGTMGLCGFTCMLWEAIFHPSPEHLFLLSLYPVAYMLGVIWRR